MHCHCGTNNRAMNLDRSWPKPERSLWLFWRNASKWRRWRNIWRHHVQHGAQTFQKLDMCLWNTDAPGGNQVEIWQKSPKSYILTQPHPKGHVMSVKCEEPIDELTVQVWWLYHHLNFKYCSLFVSGTELRTDRLTDDPITRCQK